MNQKDQEKTSSFTWKCNLWSLCMKIYCVLYILLKRNKPNLWPNYKIKFKNLLLILFNCINTNNNKKKKTPEFTTQNKEHLYALHLVAVIIFVLHVDDVNLKFKLLRNDDMKNSVVCFLHKFSPKNKKKYYSVIKLLRLSRNGLLNEQNTNTKKEISNSMFFIFFAATAAAYSIHENYIT